MLCNIFINTVLILKKLQVEPLADKRLNKVHGLLHAEL